MATAARKTAPYEGPECPRCAILFGDDLRSSGTIICPNCGLTFEASAFNPPQRKLQVVEVAQSGPEGANACANHERNTAVTSCQRCGLYICSLCDMNVGTGSYCPSCFDRVRTEGSLSPATTRFKDYASMARTSAIVGFLCGILLPIAIVIAAVTVIGLPLALLSAAILAVLIGLSEVPVAVWLGERILHARTPLGRQSTIVNFFLGALIMLVVGIVPVIGPIALFVASWLGFGSILLSAWAARERQLA